MVSLPILRQLRPQIQLRLGSYYQILRLHVMIRVECSESLTYFINQFCLHIILLNYSHRTG